jgi:hypothetical protein
VEILKRLGPRELTVEEKAEREEAKRRRALEALLKSETMIFRDRIINRLTQLGLCHRLREGDKSFMSPKFQKVQIGEAKVQPEAIYLRVTGYPFGISLLQLVTLDVLTNLSLACNHRVACKYNENIGLWYIVERASGVMGIPIHVKYADMLDRYPKTSDELTIPLGMSSNSRAIFRSVVDMPHLLIAGATDSGKSNMMNVIIGTLITRNKPEDLRLMLVDLKGGMEFTFFEGLPHLLISENLAPTGIIQEREVVPEALAYLVQEGERRMKVIQEAGHKNISKYNLRRKNRLPRIVLVIDEWADVRLSRCGREAEDALSDLARRMRAVGIHTIVATQSPKREVISTLIKTNLPAKMAFSCPSYVASELIIDVGDAKGLTPQGRFIWQHGSETIQIQAPYMPDAMIREIVSKIIAGEQPEIGRRDITVDEILEWALDNLDGKLPSRQLYQKYSGRVSLHELNALLQGLDDTTITIRDRAYKIIPGRGRDPRKMEFLNK